MSGVLNREITLIIDDWHISRSNLTKVVHGQMRLETAPPQLISGLCGAREN
jgi:hypothetical protein